MKKFITFILSFLPLLALGQTGGITITNSGESVVITNSGSDVVLKNTLWMEFDNIAATSSNLKLNKTGTNAIVNWGDGTI